MSDKNELLDEVDVLFKPKRSLDLSYFMYLFLILLLVGMFAFPKIYITEQIYFKSRDIAKLKVEYDTLKEENRLISASVESRKFKNQVLDTLF